MGAGPEAPDHRGPLHWHPALGGQAALDSGADPAHRAHRRHHDDPLRERGRERAASEGRLRPGPPEGRRRGQMILLLCALLLGAPQAGEEPPLDPADILDALLGGLMGLGEISGEDLQKEVAQVGGIPFRSTVPLDFMSREDLKGYLEELVEAEYPPEQALADQRTLVGLSLMEPGTDLRALRARVLEENIAGFYDIRPGHKRLYAVSSNRRLSPSNQVVLAHELRHAMQDQYMDVDKALP